MVRSRIKTNLDRPAFACDPTRDDIMSWALDQDGGGLPGASAMAFTAWLDEGWDNWTDDTTVTLSQVLQGAVTEWCGGRTF